MVQGPRYYLCLELQGCTFSPFGKTCALKSTISSFHVSKKRSLVSPLERLGTTVRLLPRLLFAKTVVGCLYIFTVGFIKNFVLIV